MNWRNKIFGKAKWYFKFKFNLKIRKKLVRPKFLIILIDLVKYNRKFNILSNLKINMINKFFNNISGKYVEGCKIKFIKNPSKLYCKV